VPAQLACVGIESDDAGGIEVHVSSLAGACGDAIGIIEIRGGVAGSPVDQVEIGIVGSREPGRTATEAPAIPFPGFITFLTGSGHHVPAPGDASGFGVERGEIAAMRLIAAVASDDDLVLDDERRGEVVAAALLGIVDADLPSLLAGFLIERDQEIVPGAEDNLAIAERYSAVLDEIGVTARDARARGRVAILPDHASLGRVERENARAGGDEVQDAIGHDRCGAKVLRIIAGLENPRREQILDVRSVDLVERAIAPGELGATVVGPVCAGDAGILSGQRQHSQ